MKAILIVGGLTTLIAVALVVVVLKSFGKS